MRASVWSVAVASVLATAGAAGFAGCSSKSSDEEATPATPTSTPADIGTAYLTAPLPHLSDYNLFDVAPGTLTPRTGVVPYDLNTPLFSDYALKSRTIWLPKGMPATYSATDAFDFPVGTIVSKTFAFPDNQATPKVITRVETRLLVMTAAGWVANTYRWNAAQTDADLLISGEVVPVSFVDASGAQVSTNYLVPNADQCKTCHQDSNRTVHVIGLQARHLNRDFTYPNGTTENQFTHWTNIGYLTGADSPDVAPKNAVWDDPSTGTTEQRARAWLEINCAHCHNPTGTSRTTGLTLTVAETDPYALGICKGPVAAGKGTGNFSYDVVPGSPDTSILVFRLASTEPDIEMPALGRSLVPTEQLALIRDWVSGLPTTACKMGPLVTSAQSPHPRCLSTGWS